jgi:hypothetical protein
MLAIIALLIGIEIKLEDISATQHEILQFLNEKEISILEGNFNYLTEILNSFKYNYNDEKWQNANYIKVMDIKQDADKEITLFLNLIKKELSEKRSLSIDATSTLNKLTHLLKNLQKSIYLYCYSQFVEVLIHGDYRPDYLMHLSNRIREKSVAYRKTYTTCYNVIENIAKNSLQYMFIDTLSGISTASGEAIAKTPIISNLQIDETLIENGKKINHLKTSNEQKIAKTLINEQSSRTDIFADYIDTINSLMNKSYDIAVDKDNIYLINSENNAEVNNNCEVSVKNVKAESMN